MVAGLKPEISAELDKLLSQRNDIVVNDDKIIFTRGKRMSSISLPNGVDFNFLVKIINNHINNINRGTGEKMEPLI